jgi:putative sterol carrier protein
MTLDEVFAKLEDAFLPEAAAGLNATVQFNTNEPRHLVIDDGGLEVVDGSAEQYTVALTMADDDLRDLLLGDLNGMTAFMTGKLKLDGDMMFAQRLTGLFDTSKLKGATS